MSLIHSTTCRPPSLSLPRWVVLSLVVLVSDCLLLVTPRCSPQVHDPFEAFPATPEPVKAPVEEVPRRASVQYISKMG